VHQNLLEGNHIGWNPFGIALLYQNNSNVVENTDWLDGHTAIIRFSDSNTVIDAGSHYRGLPGIPTRFHDWIAVARIGQGAPGLLSGKDINVVTGGTWDFGDGQTMALTPDQLQGAPPPVTEHTYTATGDYTATLTVNGTNNLNEPVTFTDTTTVTIQDSPDAGILSLPAGHEPWPSLGNDPQRTFYNGAETKITKNNVNQLGVKWRFPTTEPVTATPAVATIDIGGTPTKAVFDGSYSGTMYALLGSNGAPLWVKCLVPRAPEPFCDPQLPTMPDRQQAYGAIVNSPTVADISLPGGASEERVFVGVGAEMVALNVINGEERWRFTAATSSPTYSISGSPVVVGDTLYFGMDCNNKCDYGGGIFALDAATGHLKWFWDVHSGATFRPSNPTMQFDPSQMRDKDGAGNPVKISRDCGAVWSSPAIDADLGLLYIGTADCADVPITGDEEALVALNASTGEKVWRFQPRQLDKRDMDFGATPNVFRIGDRHVVGAGDKNGIYYAFDARTGDELWSTKLVLGGNFGGFYGTATDGKRIYLNNAISELTDFATPHEERLRGQEFALDARTGNVEWVQHLGSASVGMNSVTPGIFWTGGLAHLVHAWDADTGAPLWSFPLSGASSSAPIVAGGELYLGAGTGATYRAAVGDSDPLGASHVEFPHPIPVSEYGQGIYSFCVTTDPDCAAARADGEAAKRSTVVTYDGPGTSDTHDPLTASATLREALALGAPVQGGQVTFEIGSESCTATSGADGKATCTLTPMGKPGNNTIETTFPGDATRRASNDFDPIAITKDEAAVAYTGPASVTSGGHATLAGRLTADDGTPINNRSVDVSISGGGATEHCAADTNSNGTASCDVSDIALPPGTATATVTFDGDDFRGAAQASGPIAVAPAPPSVPGAPRKVGALPEGSGKAKVTFLPPSSNGGAAIDRYLASCSAPGKPTRTATGAGSPLTVAPLFNGTTYSCTVKAHNAAGNGPVSDPASVRVGAPSAPRVVLAAKGSALGSIKVAWGGTTVNAAPIVDYLVTCTSDTGSSKSTRSKVSPITITGLARNHAYTCTVAARNRYGTGPSRRAATATHPR
jgi:polyvinyl alcohol dehydrogenase (cytochrome)